MDACGCALSPFILGVAIAAVAFEKSYSPPDNLMRSSSRGLVCWNITGEEVSGREVDSFLPCCFQDLGLPSGGDEPPLFPACDYALSAPQGGRQPVLGSKLGDDPVCLGHIGDDNRGTRYSQARRVIIALCDIAVSVWP